MSDKIERRKHPRFIKRLETRVSINQASSWTISGDLSESGLFIRTNRGYNIGTPIDIELSLPGNRVSFLKGIVRRTIRTPIPTMRNGMGIEVIEKDETFRDFVKSIIGERRENAGEEQTTPDLQIISSLNCEVSDKDPRNTIQDRRRYKRIRVEHMGVNSEMPSASYVKIVDISKNGVFVKADRKLDIGKKYSLKIEYENEVLFVKAVVVWSLLEDNVEVADGPEAHAGEGIGRHRAGQQLAGRGQKSHQQAVENPGPDRKEVEQAGVAGQGGRVGDQLGDRVEHVLGALQRGGKHPHERHQHDHRAQDEQQVDDRFGTRTPLPARAAGFWIARGLFIHPPVLQTGLHHRDHEHQQEQHPRKRGGVPHVVVAEGIVDDLLDHGGGGAGRAAAGHDPDLIEDLEGADQRDDQGKEGGRRKHGQGDVAKTLPGIGAIHRGGFIILVRNILQPAQEDGHQVAGVLPNAGDNDRQHGPIWVEQPGGALDAEQAEQKVDQAILGIENPGPQQGHRHPGRNDRHEEGRPKDGLAGQAAVEQQGRPQAGSQHQGNITQQVSKGMAQGCPKFCVGEQVGEVFQADKIEGRRQQRVPGGKSQAQRGQDRPDHENEQASQAGGQEENHPQCFSEPVLAGHSSLTFLIIVIFILRSPQK